MKNDILDLFRKAFDQKEYLNPADYIKHNLDSRYDPFWFVFLWEDRKHHSANYSYYNEDDKVFEFRVH